jgi:hypothetical protein
MAGAGPGVAGYEEKQVRLLERRTDSRAGPQKAGGAGKSPGRRHHCRRYAPVRTPPYHVGTEIVAIMFS